jgi:hypothetical protein
MTISAWFQKTKSNVKGAINSVGHAITGTVSTAKGAVATVYGDVKSGVSGAGAIVSKGITSAETVAVGAENTLGGLASSPLLLIGASVGVIYLMNQNK